MEIVIENEPYHRPSSASPGPTYLRSPITSNQHLQAQQPLVNSSNAFYYATLPRGGNRVPTANLATIAPDGAPMTTAVRRVDKSGLLNIATDLEPLGRQTSLSASGGGRLHHLGQGVLETGTLSRRIERSASLLEAVPELPDHCNQRINGLASEELLAAAATTRSMVERQQHILGAESSILESAALLRKSQQTIFEPPCEKVPKPPSSESGPRVKFAIDETTILPPPPQHKDEQPKEQPKKIGGGSNVVTDCLGRLSPRQQRERHTILSSIPDVIEAHGTGSTGATLTVISSGNKNGPEGERAEAEGCEHTALESVEEAPRVAYKSGTGTTGKMGHGDNIQAVHVIILSEQL